MRSAWSVRSPYLLVSIAVFLLDQVTKRIVFQSMVQHESITVIPHFLNITYIHNRGAVFGLGSNFSTPYLSWVLSLLSVISVVVILAYFLKASIENHRLYTGLALVLGGAMGNLFDRLKNGYVIDFLDLHWFSYYWPTFNVADMAICIGVGLLLLSLSGTADAPKNTVETVS